MQSVIYIIIVFFVTCLLLAFPLFPFWKVWRRIKSNHPALWADKGPFDVHTMTAHPSVVRNFMEIIADKGTAQGDAELTKWAGLAHEISKMAPRSFLAQIGYFFVFLYFVAFFTRLILQAFS